MKIILLFLIINTVINTVSAIEITEVELNPPGSDTGKEWIELYSKSEIDLSKYKIINGDDQEIQLSGSFSGYYIINLEKQWLDNSNESIKLIGPQLSETTILTDSKNDDFTWQYCNDDWELIEETKGEECKDQEEKSNEIKKDEIEEKEQITSTTTIKQPVIEKINNSPIILNNQKLEDQITFYSKEYNLRIFIAYAFSIITLLILFLVIKNKL